MQKYFDKKRPFAAGIASVGIAMGVLVCGTAYNLLIFHYGWRGACIVHSGIILNGVVFGALFKPLPCVPIYTLQTGQEIDCVMGNAALDAQDGHTATGKKKCCNICDDTVLKSATFLVYAIGNMCFQVSVNGWYQLIPSWAAFNGLDRHQTGVIVIVIGVSSFIGRVATSFISNMKCVNRTFLAACVVATGGVVLCLNFCIQDFISTIVVVFLYGLTVGK